MLHPNKKIRGMTLLELAVGGVITGIVIWAGVAFINSNQKRQMRSALELKANSEMQEFFAQLRKTMVKVAANGVRIDPASNGSPFGLNINRNLRDSVTLQLQPAGDTAQLIQVQCAPLPSELTPNTFPGHYLCPSACPPGTGMAPISFSITVRNANTFFPTTLRDSNGQPLSAFPSGHEGNHLGASLCASLNGNQLSVSLTYLIRHDTSNDLIFRYQTELFTVPQATGAPRPEILGNIR